ncbi:MAG TPA: aminotransferase class III-fold pyridoxal phosphate-dependent enzyme [Thermoplasmata archaeon]|nr:aminotransferase class III-fold pyridoxal phosphate-dependent enzyme [Thermoplasmata archaeon]
MTERSPGAREFAASSHRPLAIVRAEGAALFDDRGRRYVDLGATHGAGSLGPANPEVAEAIARQAKDLLHLGSGYRSPVRTAFLEKLLGLLPSSFEKVFLSNSGTEAVEAAIKIARSATGRPKVVAAMRGFHGRTLGALSATWRRELREPFEPLVPGFTHVPFNDVEALDAAVDSSTALILLEPVQGEGGVHVATGEYLAAARRAADGVGALLAFDEVQTGIARTGRMFAFQHWNVVPDVLILAKSLAGGFPIGATVTTAAVEGRFRGSHHSTFGGNPLACAAGLAALDFVEREHLAERAERLGSAGIARLRGLPADRVREVRGLGLLIGLELRTKVAPYLAALEERGYLAIPAGATVLRLIPPLVISDADWAAGLAAVEEVVTHGSG